MENEHVQTVIAADVEITGTIKGSGIIRIDGKFDGELQCDKDALIGKSATVKGNVNAGSVIVEGTVNGNLSAKDKIELKSSARLTGDIKAKRLIVEEGVLFVGRSDVNPSGAASAVAPGGSSAAAAPVASGAQPESAQRAGIFKR